jgi:predicted HTH transcriptional regulator
MKDSLEWDEAEVASLIENQVQESLTLDYKRSDALGKTDSKRNELSKDISAFANSAGGVILYGMMEDKHFPTEMDDGLDPNEISKEWIEQVINSSVYPKVDGLRINQIPLSSKGSGKVLYAIYIPAATSRAPHQARDNTKRRPV